MEEAAQGKTAKIFNDVKSGGPGKGPEGKKIVIPQKNGVAGGGGEKTVDGGNLNRIKKVPWIKNRNPGERREMLDDISQTRRGILGRGERGGGQICKKEFLFRH